MKPYLNALQFLSVLPLKTAHPETAKDFAKVIAVFPLAGLTIGILLALAHIVLSAVFPASVTAVLVVLFMAWLTGGMHLDGLADTVDGLASGAGRDRMLEIMRDSRIGAMGAIALTGTLMLKAALIAAIPQNLAPAALVVMSGAGRWSMIFPMRLFPYAREDGKAKIFLGSVTPAAAVTATVIVLAAAVTLVQVRGAAVVVAAGLAGYLAARRISARLNGITGDVLGTVNEVTETSFLLMFYLVSSRIIL